MGIQARSVSAQILNASETENHCATICLQQKLNVFAKTGNACSPWRRQTENMPGWWTFLLVRETKILLYFQI